MYRALLSDKTKTRESGVAKLSDHTVLINEVAEFTVNEEVGKIPVSYLCLFSEIRDTREIPLYAYLWSHGCCAL